MTEFTGRLGNFQANGVNTKENINYKIVNYDELALDGYGFAFEFDGSAWDFVDVNNDGTIQDSEKPPNYEDAAIVYSSDQEIHLVLNQTSPPKTDPDLRIQLDQAAVATDSFGFDINNANSLHNQGIEGQRYFGTAANGKSLNDNTTLEINDPSVMTHDSAGVGIVWNPVGNTNTTPISGQWSWSNPEIANSAGTLVSGLTLTDSSGALPTTAATTTILNAEDFVMSAQNINLRYDGADWDWNDSMKVADFNNTYSFVPTNAPSLSVTAGSEGAIATDTAGDLPVLYWMGDQWSVSSGAAVTSGQVGNTWMAIDTAASSSTSVVFDIWYNDIAGASTATYTFGSTLTTAAGQSISFIMDPTPSEEYSDAVLTNSTSGTQAFNIDFDGDNVQDLYVNPTAGGAVGLSSYFSFSVDPDVPPPEYANATLKGDQTEVLIDLDGSGNESDDDDIRFVFDDPLKFGPATHPYNDRNEISFDILGSTAWTQIEKSDIEQTGFYSFTTDFLGGDYGSTETDIALNLGSTYVGTNFVNDSLSTTQYAKSSSTVFQDADGYSAGDLQGVDVASDGILTGVYSNGQLIPLFRVGLAKFLNNYGLKNEGGNLFRETRDSGGAITNKPGENGLGTLAPNSLEMSNVDIAEEFVNMITNQRGFQANSKTITTVDDMMQTVIQMKR
jgi:flagellar hook protein FlgE